MACSGFDLELTQGDYYSITLNVSDSNFTPINLSGYSVYAPIKPNWGATGSILDQFNVSMTNPTSGIMTLYLTASETAALPVSELVYMVEILPSGDANNAIKYLRGYLTVCPEI